MIALYPWYGEKIECDLDSDLYDALATEAQSGFTRFKEMLNQIKHQDEAVPTTSSQMRLKRDGTPDRRSLVTQRPRQHDAKCEAVAVRGPFIQSSKPGAVGHYKIHLACGNIVKRAATNGNTPPQPDKYYACPVCSNKR